jgi:hypothetical protein
LIRRQYEALAAYNPIEMEPPRLAP